MAPKALRIIGIVVLSLIGIVVIAVGIIWFLSSRQLNHSYSVTPPPLVIGTDSATLARGRHLVEARLLCTDCHGPDLAGTVVVDAMLLGRFVASNLTRGAGGVGDKYGDQDWVRAIRDGIRFNGKPMVFMPSAVFAGLAGEDLAAVVAYVKSVAPVNKELPRTALGPIARIAVAFGQPLFPANEIDHEAPYPNQPAEGRTTEFGRYLVATSSCYRCHGSDLTGGEEIGPPGTPPSQNITPLGIGSWSEADFLRAIREGKRPDGTTINPFMPWQTFGKMTDEELGAIYMFLGTIPAKTTVIK